MQEAAVTEARASIAREEADRRAAARETARQLQAEEAAAAQRARAEKDAADRLREQERHAIDAQTSEYLQSLRAQSAASRLDLKATRLGDVERARRLHSAEEAAEAAAAQLRRELVVDARATDPDTDQRRAQRQAYAADLKRLQDSREAMASSASAAELAQERAMVEANLRAAEVSRLAAAERAACTRDDLTGSWSRMHAVHAAAAAQEKAADVTAAREQFGRNGETLRREREAAAAQERARKLSAASGLKAQMEQAAELQQLQAAVEAACATRHSGGLMYSSASALADDPNCSRCGRVVPLSRMTAMPEDQRQ
jgi:hypothetical protein